MKYAIVIEQAPGNYSAYVPDLPGCVVTGQTVADVRREITEAIKFHVEDMQLRGDPIPAPSSLAEYVDAAVTVP